MSIQNSNLNYGQISNTLPETSVSANVYGYSTFYSKNNERKSDLYNIQSGWIKRKSNNKLFSSKTSWQTRWMELRNNSIIFFESNESKTPLQIYQLAQNNLPLVLPLETLKINDKTQTLYPFLLSIENRDAKSSKEAERLATTSDEERISWIQCIKCSLFAHLGGGIFGQKLRLTLDYEQRKNPDREIPEIVEMCSIFIRSYGLQNEGLFRLTGKSSKLKLLEEMFDKGHRPTLRPINVPSIFESNCDPTQSCKYDEKLSIFEEVNGVKRSDDEVDDKCGRRNNIGSTNSDIYLSASFDNDKKLSTNRTHSSSSESQKTLENNLNHYSDNVITSGVDILNEILDINKETQKTESTPVSKTKKMSFIHNKQLGANRATETTTGLRLSKSMDITRGSKKIKKEKSTDCDSALIPLLCVHG